MNAFQLTIIGLLSLQPFCVVHSFLPNPLPLRVSIVSPTATTTANLSSIRLNHEDQFRLSQSQKLKKSQNHQTRLSHEVSKTQLSSSRAISLHLPVIDKNDAWGNIATICATASISHKIGKTTAIGRLLGPPVTAMAIAFCLGSIGFLSPGGSPGVKALQLLSIQLATPLLLLGVNIRECRKRCGPLLIAFILASLGTMLASTVAYPLCAPLLKGAMGTDGLKIAAALMAKNVGGGLNYIAVCRSLSASPNAIAAGLCVDNIFALLYFPVTSALAAGKPDPSMNIVHRGEEKGENESSPAHSKISAEAISATVAIGAVITWMGEKFGGQSAALPLATLLTILFTIVFPTIAKSLSLTGEGLGTSFLYIFFATAGAPGLSVAESVRSSFGPIGLYLTMLYGIHGLVLFMAQRVVTVWTLKSNKPQFKEECNDSFVAPSRLLVASSAAIGGPATAAALAKANKWNSLVAPSLIVGNLGYAIATFAGILFYNFFSYI